MMAFKTSSISLAHMIESGSTQAADAAPVDPPIVRFPVTPEWLAENAAKQLAYERRRAEWLKEIGLQTGDF